MRGGFDRNKDVRSGEDNLEARLGGKLDSWFASYRDACPEPEPSPDFTPRLWKRIESRRQTQAIFAWRRWAQAFLSLAAAACLLILVIEVLPSSTSAYFLSTYVEQLSEDDGPEHVLMQDVASAEARQAVQPAALRESVPEGNRVR